MLQGDVLDVVTNVLGIDGKQRGDEFDFVCPVHADRKPSAGINLETGLWHCFSCGAGGNLVSLAEAVRGVDKGTALRLVRAHTPEAMLSSLQRQAQAALGKFRRRPSLELPGPYPKEPLDYMRQRGFTDETLERYGVGFAKKEVFVLKDRQYSIRDHITIPIRDSANHLIAYIYRATTPGAKVRYLYTPGTPKASLWFGTNLFPGGDQIIVTEGSLDSMWVSQCGYPAIAALGANAEHKTGQLLKYRRVVLFMDRDTAGVMAAQRIGALLANRVPLCVARYSRRATATDPAELTPGQVSVAIQRAISYYEWRQIA